MITFCDYCGKVIINHKKYKEEYLVFKGRNLSRSFYIHKKCAEKIKKELKNIN